MAAVNGRPRKQVDYKQVFELRRIGCTDEELASALDVSVEWIRQRKHSDAKFLGAYEKGWADLRMSLRRRIVTRALGNDKDSHIMAIWASKNILGWSDRQELSGPQGGPIRIELSEAAQRIRDQLRKAGPEAPGEAAQTE